jgi:hypothetical protein
MATPKPGEIRCPTCHRSTPPAAFCTQCGTAIPPDARIRPRGMDRDELQERIRARRSGGEPYRRGGMADDELPGYERFEPEPEDARARPYRPGEEHRSDHFDEGEPPAAAVPPYRGEPASEEAPRRDLTRDRDEDWGTAAAVPAAAAAPHAAHAGEPPSEEPAHVDNFDDAAYADEGYYEYDEWEEDRERRSGGGALAILGFLALGVLALLGGAMLAGIFGEDPGVGQNGSPSPSPTATAVATDSPIASPTSDGTPDESPDATPTPEPGEPVVFPDGFVAETQACLPGSAGTNGCDSNAETNSGSLWVWVGFRNGTQDDVIGAELIGPDGNTVGEGSIDLARIGCRPTCPGGWTYFPFSNLQPGEYRVETTRNGQPAGGTRFEVVN